MIQTMTRAIEMDGVLRSDMVEGERIGASDE